MDSNTRSFLTGKVLAILAEPRTGKGPSALEEDSLRHRVYNLDGDPSDHLHPDYRTDVIWKDVVNKMWNDGLIQIMDGFKKASWKDTRLLCVTTCGQIYLDNVLLQNAINDERKIYR